mgnify:CR=1 FL=1
MGGMPAEADAAESGGIVVIADFPVACGLQQAADAAGVPVRTTRVGGMFGLFFTDAPKVVNFAEVEQCDIEAFRKFFHLMLERGVYLAPSAYEAGFVSSAHTEEHIHATVAAARDQSASALITTVSNTALLWSKVPSSNTTEARPSCIVTVWGAPPNVSVCCGANETT